MKKKTIQSHLVNLDMFPSGIIIFQDKPDVDEFQGVFNKYTLQKDEVNKICEVYQQNRDANGFCISGIFTGGMYVVVVFDTGDKSTLVHELLHAVYGLMRHRNLPISEDTEELRCMLLGRIFASLSTPNTSHREKKKV